VESAARTIARAVHARRLELRLSTEEAAARARIPEKSWRVIEDGTQEPSALMIGALCRVLEWTPATIEHLLGDQIHLNGNGQLVVELDASERAEAAPDPEPIALDVQGLTREQLHAVQAYIDELRGRFS
jgi:hypothetical protein